MGSEGPPGKVIHVTGFKKFHGVAENPTEIIVSKLKEFVDKRGGLSNGASLGSSTVIETAGEGALAALYALLESSLPNKNLQGSSDNTGISLAPSSNNHCRVIWVHLGVNSGATKFAVESQAVNEATFRCPDEMGWQPQRAPIIPEDGNILHLRETTLPAKEIVEALVKKGYDVVLSDDAGRFVCNYVYYHSLCYAAKNNIKSLFVHVPMFSKVDEESQMQFLVSLLEVLGSIE